MRYLNINKKLKRAFLALLAVTMSAGPSVALELAAVPAEWSPDGGTTIVPMWGFVEVPDAATYSCPVSPVSWTGGAVLNASAGPLTINVKNCLANDVSVFIPGLPKALNPVVGADGAGRERLISFDTVVAPSANGSYTWTATEGTYLYHSGTDVRTQVPMGLYGALVVSGAGYPTVAQEEVLIYSEIDPSLNADPTNFGGARVSSWNPQYFLINGFTHNAANPPINITVGENVLLRFVNAGLETFVPTFSGGLYMDVIAEDGNLYPYPIKQYGLELAAGKTMDAVINAGMDGSYAIYDRSLHLANGGLLTYLQAGTAAGAPTAVNDTYAVAEDGSLTADGIIPNPAGVLDNDTGGIAAVLVSGPSAGTLTGGLAADGSFTYEPNADFNGNDQFTYTANDGAGGPASNLATVSITVTPVNDPPVAVADSATTPLNTPVDINVASNDSDIDGNLDLTSVTITIPASNGVAASNGDGTVTYTPTGGYFGPDSFEYQICDTGPLCATATVDITVEATPPANIAPTAVDDFPADVTRGSIGVIINVIANDSDPDGSIDPTSINLVTGPNTQRGGSVTANPDGTVTYDTPSPGWRGTDTFQYTVNDNDGEPSNTATVYINVVK